MMTFEVKLLKVPSLDNLSGWDVFDLMGNARHVAGDYWIYEGDVEGLIVQNVTVVAEGVTEGHGEMDEEALVNHCDEIFGVDLGQEPMWWDMCLKHERNC